MVYTYIYVYIYIYVLIHLERCTDLCIYAFIYLLSVCLSDYLSIYLSVCGVWHRGGSHARESSPPLHGVQLGRLVPPPHLLGEANGVMHGRRGRASDKKYNIDSYKLTYLYICICMYIYLFIFLPFLVSLYTYMISYVHLYTHT